MFNESSCFSGTDKPNLSELSLTVIYQHAAHWETLGALLELKDHHIANISRDYHGRSVDACREMLMMWLRVVPSPTWGKLDDAIKSIMNASTSKARGMFNVAIVILTSLISYSNMCIHSFVMDYYIAHV